MDFSKKTTSELEEKDLQLTAQLVALKSWANRGLSAKNRSRLVEGIREEQNLITAELMKREGN